jgi:hypothetical protein
VLAPHVQLGFWGLGQEEVVDRVFMWWCVGVCAHLAQSLIFIKAR